MVNYRIRTNVCSMRYCWKIFTDIVKLCKMYEYTKCCIKIIVEIFRKFREY